MTADDVSQYIGKDIPQSYNPGFVVLSYVVSYIGALTTLELLHKRTAGRGRYNWYVHLLPMDVFSSED
jgi:NO-binding membrane sensor protein with MHYT domain